MDQDKPDVGSKLESFYYLAEEYEQVEEKEISPTLDALSRVSERYQSAELIAVGGIKQVYKVYDARGKRHLAMAMLHADAPLELCDPFIHEAWLTALLDHPNIITIHDVGVRNGRPYFTMDLKTGYTLRELLEKLRERDRKTLANYPRETLLQLFLKICDAVSYAHSVNVLHLDLKPANIQVGEFGEVQVCDWGLGKMVGRDDGLELDRKLLHPDLLSSGTLFGQVKGTPGYMAPEQVEDGAERDVRTDVYGLGCILYTILTLERPLDGKAEKVLEKTQAGAIVPPRQRRPEGDIPKSLEAVVMKALAVDSEKRYQTAEALRKEVGRYLTGFATQAENAGVLTQFGLFYRRNRRFCLTILCSALIIFNGMVWSFIQLAEKERTASAARREAESTLALYEAGQNELEKMSFENARSVVNKVEQLHLIGDEMRTLRLLETALRNDPENPVYLRAMGMHWFYQQHFNQAVNYLDRGMGSGDEICEATRYYARLKPDDEIRLSAEQVVDLLHRIKHHSQEELMVVVNDHKKRLNLDERAMIIEEYLQSINPGWTNGWFEYDATESHLRVGGKGLTRLATTHSVLVGLQPRTLDISGSEVEHLWRETGYAIQTLDLRGVPLETIFSLQRFVHLRKLIVHPGQFSERDLAELPGWVEIVEKD